MLKVLAATESVLCAPKTVIKMLMTTVMKTKVVAALLSWFKRHWCSTSFRFSLAAETRRSGWVVMVVVGGLGSI